MPAIERPHFGHPYVHGQYVEQGTVEHRAANVLRILSCPQGARVTRPEFGIPWPHMENLPLDPGPIIDAVRRFEPNVTDVEVLQALDQIAQGVGEVEVDISVLEGGS